MKLPDSIYPSHCLVSKFRMVCGTPNLDELNMPLKGAEVILKARKNIQNAHNLKEVLLKKRRV
ncbi:MAG: hypothetical protein ABIW76_09340 [Fibrobacteria bacterium]